MLAVIYRDSFRTGFHRQSPAWSRDRVTLRSTRKLEAACLAVTLPAARTAALQADSHPQGRHEKSVGRPL